MKHIKTFALFLLVSIFAFSAFACSAKEPSESEATSVKKVKVEDASSSQEEDESTDISDDCDEYYEDEETDYYEGFSYSSIEPLSTDIDEEYLFDESRAIKIVLDDSYNNGTTSATNGSTIFWTKDIYIDVLKLTSYSPDGSELASIEMSNIYQIDTRTIDYITTYKDSETTETIYCKGEEGFDYNQEEFEYIPDFSNTNARVGGLVTGEDGKSYYCLKYNEISGMDDTLLFDAETKELRYMNSIPVTFQYIDELSVESYLNSKGNDITTIDNFYDYDDLSFSYVDKYLQQAN